MSPLQCMARLLVTVGTDGFTDWVKLPTGARLNLGTISVLKLVTTLAPSAKAARRALSEFLEQGEALVSVDETKMWELFAPRRALRASDGDGPFMAPDHRTVPASQGQGTMLKDLENLEKHVAALNAAATKQLPAEKMAEGHGILTRLASRLTANFDQAAPAPASAPEVEPSGLAYDTIKANEAAAQDILEKAASTVDTIEKLAAAGKPFNAAKAKADVHAVTSRIAGIVGDTDLTADWVKGDLQKLAAEMNRIHGLFASAKA